MSQNEPSQESQTANNPPVATDTQRKKTPTWIILVMILVGLSIIIYAKTLQNEPSKNKASIATALDLVLPDLKGNHSSIRQVIEGKKVVLVNNFAMWCPSCNAEMAELEAYYQKHKDDGFTIIAIDVGESKEDIQKYVDTNGLSFPVWVDTETKAMTAFAGAGLPYSLVIDQKGNVRETWLGGVTIPFLEEKITPLLKE